MENLYKYISAVIIGIDRIDFSVPMFVADNLMKQLSDLSESDDTPAHQSKPKPEKLEKPQYWNKDYLINGDWVTVSAKKKKDFDYNNRLYVNVYDPQLTTQQIIADVLKDITGGISKGTYGAIIRQLEVSYDIYCHNEADCQHVHDILSHHLVLSYAKKSSYKPFKTTEYIGKDGNIRKGVRGIRCYVKTQGGKTFCRLEFQYNRPYLLKNDITVLCMPISPLHFQSLAYIALLDNCTLKGIRNLSRTVLRKRDITESTTSTAKAFNKLHRQTMNKISKCVLGGERGKLKSVPMQLAAFKDIAKEAGVSGNSKQYFPSADHIVKLIGCHAEIGYQEDRCSKRMAYCQMG